MSEPAPRTSAVRRIAAMEAALPPEAIPPGARGRILGAALGLFADVGYAGTSVRDICARAEVQATTLYSHFPSKEHVLAEILRLGHEQHFRYLRSALLASQPDPVQQLSAMVRAHVIVHCEYAKLAAVANAELHALSESMAPPILALIQQLIDKGHAYHVPGADVYYRVRSFQGYGKLSGKNLDDLQSGARITMLAWDGARVRGIRATGSVQRPAVQAT